jgi:uncharacterized protein YaiL (DUF2058 family)
LICREKVGGSQRTPLLTKRKDTMKVKELINRLKLEDSNKDIRFYFLEHNVLQGCQLETILEADDQVEITIQTETEL